MTGTGFDAFISYSTAGSADLAARLQRRLERFATPWYQPRRLRVFRDLTTLPAGPDLWRVIEAGLARSRTFLLLASPEAAASPWVDREVRWWREQHGSAEFRIVLTGGVLRWNPDERDWDAATDALPPAAYGMFAAEPFWVDVSDLDRTVARIAGPLHGVDVDTLVGEHLTYERRARRQRRGGVAVLAVLLVLSLITSVLTVRNARQADRQSRTATARAVAAAALAATGDNQQLASLLAVEAYRLEPNPQTSAALHSVVSANPQLVGYLPLPGTSVTRVAATGGTVFAGTIDGRVVRWDGTSFTELMRVAGDVGALGVSADGRTVVAGGKRAMIWTSGGGAREIPAPAGQRLVAVGVSPDGRTAVTTGDAGGVTVSGPAHRSVVLPGGERWARVVVPSDHEAVVLGGSGRWDRLSLPDLRRLGGADGPGGAPTTSAISADGRYVTYAEGGSTMPVVPTRSSAVLRAGSRGPQARAVAISADHRRTATAVGGRVYLGRPGSPAELTELAGNAAIEQDALAFDGHRLLAGIEEAVVVWDLDRPGRTLTSYSVPVPSPCFLCGDSWLAVDDARTEAVAVRADGTAALRYALREGTAATLPGDVVYGPPVPTPGGFLLTTPATGGIVWPGGGKVTNVYPASWVRAAARMGDRIVVVDHTTTVHLLDARDGRLIRTVAGPDTSDPANGSAPDPDDYAIDTDRGLVAVNRYGESVQVIHLDTGRIESVISVGATRVAIGGGRLAVQRGTSVDLFAADGLREARTIVGDPSSNGPIALSRDGTRLAQARADGTITVRNTADGEPVAGLRYVTEPAGQRLSMTFAADGTLVVAVAGGPLQQWTLAPAELIRLACATAGRDLRIAEWEQNAGTSPPADLRCLR